MKNLFQFKDGAGRPWFCGLKIGRGIILVPEFVICPQEGGGDAYRSKRRRKGFASSGKKTQLRARKPVDFLFPCSTIIKKDKCLAIGAERVYTEYRSSWPSALADVIRTRFS